MTKRIINTICLMTVVCLFTACSGGNEDYVTVIPKNASSVMSVNLASIVKKSDLTNTTTFKTAKTYLGTIISSNMQSKVEELIDDPSLMGIDFDSPVYAFEVGDQYFGLSMKVDDESLLDEFLEMLSKQSLCSKVKEHDDLKWCYLLDDICMTYSDNTLLLMVQHDGGTKKVNEMMMLALMQQEEEESFVSTGNYQKMMETGNDDIDLYGNLSAFGHLFDSLKDSMPQGTSIANIETLCGINFNEDGVDIKANLFSSNPKLQGMLNDLFKSFKKNSGNYCGKLPKECKSWACAGVDGGKLLSVLKTFPSIKEKLIAAGLGVDVDNMMRSIDGDMLMIGKGDDKTFYAQLKDSKFLDDVEDWKESDKDYGINLVTVGKDQYQIKGDEVNMYWGVDGKELYFGKEPYKKLDKTGNTKFDNDIKNNNVFIYLDAKQLRLPMFSNVVITSNAEGVVNAKLNVAGSKGNVLKSILNKGWKR